MDTTRGACLCGDLAFEATLPSKWVAHCHCTLCQRAHGAPVVTWVGFDENQARIDDPQAIRSHAPWLVLGDDGLARKKAPAG